MKKKTSVFRVSFGKRVYLRQKENNPMLDIIDINSSADCLNEIVELKESFRSHLTNVNDGTVIIINNFPAHEIVDYLIIVNIERSSGNYYRTTYNNSNHYVDNIVLAVLKLEGHGITGVDENNLYSDNSSFDYIEANREFNNQLKAFFSNFQRVWCRTLFHISNIEETSYFSPELLLNGNLTAEKIMLSFTFQQLNQYPKSNRISAFSKDISANFNTLSVQEFAKNIIGVTNENFEYGILTKKKLDLIAIQKNKIVDNIHEHIGSSINIISGKAGTGKTIYLAKSIYRWVRNNHRARFLTFNHVLIKDIKCTLRGYENFDLSNFSASTVHKYFYKLVEKMGINLILSEHRVNELIEICELRFEKFKPTYEKIKNQLNFTEKFLLDDVTQREKDKSNYPEFREIAKYLRQVKDFRDWDKIKNEYLNKKRQFLLKFIGSKVFIEDYPKVLETLYLSITDTEKFYTDFNISNRYELLSFVYKVDKQSKDKKIPYKNVKKQVQWLKRSANWSIIFIDEAQDCEQYEKEILFELRGSKNMVVASGGKEQLIRTSGVRLWNLSNGRKIPFNLNTLSGISYRQKENIIDFVNVLAKEYTINLQLKSHTSSKGVGKIILDLRNDHSLYNFNQINQLLKYGKLNECSIYESLMILVTSKYIDYESEESFKVDVTDHVVKENKSINRTLREEEVFINNGISVWSGVSENKSKLQVPFQNQPRVISYDSCRGLEAWSVMCLDLDGFIEAKRNSDDAQGYLADDLFLSEEQRKDKYALIWLLMAFTRPIDTLYLDLRKRNNSISKKIVEICRKLKGVEILE